jgi:hypothetical protein
MQGNYGRPETCAYPKGRGRGLGGEPAASRGRDGAQGALAKKGMDLKALKCLSHALPRVWREFTTQYRINGTTFDGVR